MQLFSKTMKGSYTLILELKKDKEIQIGKLGKIIFRKGFYVYVGSALGGLESRISRHLRNSKKIHWHIDYLLEHSKIIDIFYTENDFKEECNLAKKFEEKLLPIPHFGCSDCDCDSHLFFGDIFDIESIIKNFDMRKYHFK